MIRFIFLSCLQDISYFVIASLTIGVYTCFSKWIMQLLSRSIDIIFRGLLVLGTVGDLILIEEGTELGLELSKLSTVLIIRLYVAHIQDWISKYDRKYHI